MEKYYVNKNAQNDGYHEVHNLDKEKDCHNPADSDNRRDLGEHLNCTSALIKARTYYKKVDGCKDCAPKCHTR